MRGEGNIASRHDVSPGLLSLGTAGDGDAEAQPPQQDSLSGLDSLTQAHRWQVLVLPSDCMSHHNLSAF